MNESRRNLDYKIKDIQKNKFKKLMENAVLKSSRFITLSEENKTFLNQPIIHNMSSRVLSEFETNLLNLGLNFSLPIKNMAHGMIDTAASVELKLMSMELDENERNNIRKGVAKIMEKYVTKEDLERRWDKWIIKSIRSLIHDKNICISKSDKGNKVVIMNREEYDLKMERMLEDGPYKQLLIDPTNHYMKKIETKFKELEGNKTLTKAQITQLQTKNPRCPIIYGSPKIHKTDVPFRPIVDFRNSPTYNLASYLASILKKLASNHPYSVKNSTELVERLENLRVRRGESMISYDVVNMFTMIPIPEAINYIQFKLENEKNLKDWTQLNPEQIISLVEMCITCTYFKYKCNFFSQEYGCAMGSPLSPVVAELFLQNLENTKIHKNPAILFWNRYVDDVSCIIRNRKKDEFLKSINDFHPSIQFTTEEEKEGKLPFLDVMQYRKADNSIGHCVYRKNTQTWKYLNYKSFHPPSHKLGVIDTLYTRAIRLSDEDHLKEELEFTTEILIKNDYPKSLLDKRLKNVKFKCANPIPKNNNMEKRIILPWSGEVTTKIAHFLRRNLQIEIGYKPGPKLGHILCNTKQKITKTYIGVYSLGCKGNEVESCQSLYIGETERDMITRLMEHKHNVDTGSITSPISLHMLEHDHELDLNSIKLLIPETRKFFRRFKESLYIRKLPPSIKMNSSNGMIINPHWSSTLLNFFKL
jgi:hypothetical protein